MSGKPALVSDLSLKEIWNHRTDIQAALRFYFDPGSPGFQDRFFGETLEVIAERLRTRLQEADQQSLLVLLSSVEAAFRLDYEIRVERKATDDLSRSFITLYAQQGKRARLDSELFENWKKVSDLHKQAVGHLRSAFKFRDWMAHGRYWQPASGRYEFEPVYDLALQISALMGFSEFL